VYKNVHGVDRRSAGGSPAFPATVVFGLYVLCLARRCSVAAITLRIAGASETQSGRCTTTRLDASLRASAPHDFADRGRPRSGFQRLACTHPRSPTRTLFSAVRPARRMIAHEPSQSGKSPALRFRSRATLPRPPHPKPAYPDDRDTPLVSGGMNC